MLVHKHALGSGMGHSRVLRKDYGRSQMPHEIQGMHLAIIRQSPAWRFPLQSVKNLLMRRVSESHAGIGLP